LHDFYGESNYKNFLEPFPKYSCLHQFIRFIIDSITFEDLESESESKKRGETQLWVELALEHFELKYDSFDIWRKENNRLKSKFILDDISDYILELRRCGPYEELLDRMSEEIFFILFLNRRTLQRLNILIARAISDIELSKIDEEDKPFFKKDGILNRKYIPKWVQRAVFHRDRGMCVSCHKDLSGQINIGEVGNFDHVIPLALGGINDITNIQLLCEFCNKSKQAKNISTSNRYEKWY